jgi:hypothetical protein
VKICSVITRLEDNSSGQTAALVVTVNTAFWRTGLTVSGAVPFDTTDFADSETARATLSE